MKIAYLGIDLLYPALVSCAENGNIIKIFSCKCDNVSEFNTKVTTFAQNNNIPIKYERINDEDINLLYEMGCDLLICAGYYYKIPISDKFPMLNIHPAPLPQARGAWPMPLLILNQCNQGAVAIHKMTRDFDTGDILLQKFFNLQINDTLEDYMIKACSIIPEMINNLLNNLHYLLLNAEKQDESKACYLTCPDEKQWTFNSNMTVGEAGLILRAFFGYECIYVDESKNEKYEIIKGSAFIGFNDSDNVFKLKDGYIKAEKSRRL